MKLQQVVLLEFQGTVKQIRSRLFSQYDQDAGTFTVELEDGQTFRGTPRSLRLKLLDVVEADPTFDDLVGSVNTKD